MADKMIFTKQWYDAIMEDEYIQTTEQEMAYILYAAMQYSFTGEKIDLGAVFGNEFKGLNRSMPNIYSQIDNIMAHGVAAGKPIGFIDNVVKGEDDKIFAFTFVLWSKDAVVELTEEGNVAGIELNDVENEGFKLLY